MSRPDPDETPVPHADTEPHSDTEPTAEAPTTGAGTGTDDDSGSADADARSNDDQKADAATFWFDDIGLWTDPDHDDPTTGTTRVSDTTGLPTGGLRRVGARHGTMGRSSTSTRLVLVVAAIGLFAGLILTAGPTGSSSDTDADSGADRVDSSDDAPLAAKFDDVDEFAAATGAAGAPTRQPASASGTPPTDSQPRAGTYDAGTDSRSGDPVGTGPSNSAEPPAGSQPPEPSHVTASVPGAAQGARSGPGGRTRSAKPRVPAVDRSDQDGESDADSDDDDSDDESRRVDPGRESRAERSRRDSDVADRRRSDRSRESRAGRSRRDSDTTDRRRTVRGREFRVERLEHRGGDADDDRRADRRAGSRKK